MAEPLTLDPREGPHSGSRSVTRELYPFLQQLGVPTVIGTLPFGDAQIIGRGPEGRPVPIGVEIKKIPDLLGSIMDERLVGYQLPGLLDTYEVPYLLVVGNPLKLRGAWTYGSMLERLWSLENNTRLRIWFTPDMPSAVVWLGSLYRWWNGKLWEQHRSHLVLRQKDLETEDPLGSYTNKVTKKMRVAAALAEGLGPVRARAVAEAFNSVATMMSLTEAERLDDNRWRQLEGALKEIEGIGPKLAKKFAGTIRTTEEV